MGYYIKSGPILTLNNPTEIAGHFGDIYKKIFNLNHTCSKSEFLDFIGKDIKGLGKLTTNERSNLEENILFEEIGSCKNKQRISAQGGPSGVTSRYLKWIYIILPNLVHGTIHKLALGL